MTSNEIEQAREHMLAVGKRARQDPAFNQQIQDNPVEALKSAGLSEGEIGDYIKEEGIEGEVSGYKQGEWWCICTEACCCTDCCNSM